MSIQQTAHGYAFIPGVFQYCAGVLAQPGFRIERVMLEQPLALKRGFAEAARYLQSVGVPLNALCACELRSPAPFTPQGFKSFNIDYVRILSEWGVILPGDVNPVARSNVCPLVNPPEGPSLYAFAFALPASGTDGSFIISGSGEMQEADGDYQERIVRYGDVSAEALTAKSAWVIEEMQRRMAKLGKGWADTSAVQLYTVHDIHHIMEQELAARGVMSHGLTWHLNRPPVQGLEYEMDCRRITVERTVAF